MEAAPALGPRPAAPYRARVEWPRGAGALPPAGGGRTGRGDRPGRSRRCFSFTFLPSEAGALAARSGGGGSRGVGTRLAGERPKGRNSAAPALPAQVCAGSRSGTSKHLPRQAPPGAGRALRGRGRGWPAGVWGLRGRALRSGAERAAGARPWERRRVLPGAAPARPERRVRRALARAPARRAGRLVLGPPRAVLPGPAGGRGKVPSCPRPVTASTCFL